jgi:deoxyuridine 5'-triphosphate nucleotidohydrolase
MSHHSYTGRENPNCKYKDLDDNFFSVIDTEEKAYILGLIASDGSIRKGSVTIALHMKDRHLLEKIAKVLSKDVPVKRKAATDLFSLTINSQTIATDVCRHLQIVPGKKSDVVGFPVLPSEFLTYTFIRGFFDGDGSIRNIERQNLDCKITTNSVPFKTGLSKFLGKEIDPAKQDVYWYGNGALDFLGKLYDDAVIYLPRKRDLYLDWSMFVPGLSGSGNYGREILFRWNKTRSDAVKPKKENVSDSGFDVVVLEKVKQLGKVELYDTGIKIQPDYGWYFDLVPRGSIIKTGYILANSFGVIDRCYRGTILVPLLKIDPEMPALELPARVAQIIPRPIVHVRFKEVEELDTTERGEGGFGSTGKR